jgi:phosphoglycerate dehydrogenase-like enzyme
LREVIVGLPAVVANRLIACMPKAATPIAIPDEGKLPDGAREIQFLVPTFNRDRAKQLLTELHSLEVLQTLSAGVDWLLPMAPHGITICDASGVHDTAVSEWIIAAILTMYKQFPRYRDRQRSSEWNRPTMFEADTLDLEGKAVLIVGHGSIGRATEARLAPFGVQTYRVARQQRSGVRGIGHMQELLPRADIVVLLLPLTGETRGLVNQAFLDRMKPGSLLVNASRGQLVQTDALVRCLKSGHIRAALDVTDPEPLPADHELWSLPNVLITPHVGGHSPDFLSRACGFVGGQVERYAKGSELKNVVASGY